MKRFALVLVLAACGHKAPEPTGDCIVVVKNPAAATIELSKKYPPVKVAETIEDCIAPTGEPCERLVKIVQAIPGMMGGSRKLDADALMTKCQGMPDALRRCMLPSYSLGHADECKKIGETTVTRANVDLPPAPPRDCGVVTVVVTRSGVWVSGVDGKGCFGKSAAGAVDAAWIEAALKPFVVDCRPYLQVAADDGVSHQALLSVMNLGTTVGLTDVTVAQLNDVVHWQGRDPESAPSTCEAVTATGSITPRGSQQNDSPGDTDDATQGTVIILTKNAITYDGKTVISIRDAAQGTGVIKELRAVLPPNPAGHRMTLQADPAVPYSVVVRVMDTGKAAGYGDVMFSSGK
jgi:biopolymer transport protein ExbD